MTERYDDRENYEAEFEQGEGDDTMVQVLAHAPWWMISVALHAILLTLTLFLTWQQVEKKQVTEFKISPLTPEEQPPVPEIPEDEFDEVVPLENPDDEHPILTPAPKSDHAETNDHEKFDQSKGDSDDAISDSPFKGPSTNSAIGLAGGAGGAFGSRFGGDENLSREGGSGTRSHVDLGLRWLADHQDRSRGHWDSDDFQAQCKKNTCSGRGGEGYDPGQTGLALLAFLGAGHTHTREGKYQDTVKRAVRYLMSIQDADGCFGPRRGHFMYNHAIAALAVAEAFGMTRSPLLEDSAQRGIDFLVSAQNPGFGWRYAVQSGMNDTSVTGWAVMALKSARVAELAVPVEAFEGAKNWLDSVTDGQYFRTGYLNRGDGGAQLESQLGRYAPAESSTAISIMSRVFMGADHGDALLRGQGDLLSQKLPVWNVTGGPGGTSTIDFYYWYYGTLAMFQLGGDYWKTWNSAMKGAIVKHQRTEGDERGSWDPIDAWGSEGGRVYATAVNVLSLEIYYRYDRVVK